MPNAELRQLVAEEAARLIYDEGYRDYRTAKLKATQRFGATQGHQQPSNEEIEQALHEHIRLYDAEDQAQILLQHRQIALEAMEFLQAFSPYLMGAALEGTSGPHSAVTLYLVANSAEEVIFHLDDRNIAFQQQERRLNFGKKQAYYPMLRFYVDDVEVELLIVEDERLFFNAPLSPINGKATRRADYHKLRQLIQADVKP